MPYYIDWSLNWRVAAMVVALATGLLFGLAPAMHAVRASLQDSLKDRSGAGASRNRLRGGADEQHERQSDLRDHEAAGRDFTDADGAGRTHVAIVNQVMAKRLWPNTPDVVGQRFRFVNEANDDTMTVVGVVPDVKIDGMRERRPVARAFASYAYSSARNMRITLPMIALRAE